MDIERDKRIRRFLKAFGMKAKKYESPRRMAYQKIVALTRNRRGTRSINQYLADHEPFMNVCISASEGMGKAWTADCQKWLDDAICRNASQTHNERNAIAMRTHEEER